MPQKRGWRRGCAVRAPDCVSATRRHLICLPWQQKTPATASSSGSDRMGPAARSGVPLGVSSEPVDICPEPPQKLGEAMPSKLRAEALRCRHRARGEERGCVCGEEVYTSSPGATAMKHNPGGSVLATGFGCLSIRQCLQNASSRCTWAEHAASDDSYSSAQLVERRGGCATQTHEPMAKKYQEAQRKLACKCMVSGGSTGCSYA